MIWWIQTGIYENQTNNQQTASDWSRPLLPKPARVAPPRRTSERAAKAKAKGKPKAAKK